jgi:hypothetical protein
VRRLEGHLVVRGELALDLPLDVFDNRWIAQIK